MQYRVFIWERDLCEWVNQNNVEVISIVANINNPEEPYVLFYRGGLNKN